ncbi:type III secretion protein HrpD [Cedecea davisae]|uniref:type III secretion protein HrpD n=1 Tax=Cedecea davisae TaxID=158484 RepID=UPI00376F2C8D
MDNTSPAAWLRWWSRAFWQQADASWHHLAWFQLPESQRSSLIIKSPQAVLTLLELTPGLPHEPDERLLTLASLSQQQRMILLALVAEVCQRGSGAARLENTQLVWCERLTRGLRPGVWLPAGLDFARWPEVSALWLLRPLFVPTAWQRLRLSFPHAAVTLSETLMLEEPAPPHNRLLALWDGAVWQARQHSFMPND